MALSPTNNNAAFSSSIGTNKYYWSLAFWYRRPATLNENCVLCYMNSRSAYHQTVNGIAIAGQAPTNVFTPASGDWSYVALVMSNTNLSLYCWTDTSGSTPTTVTLNASLAGTSGLVRLAGRDGYSYSMNGGEFLHLRVWEGSNSSTGVRSTAELDAERKSASPIVTTGLIQWNELDADLNADGGYGNALTAYNGNYTFTTGSYPTQLSGGASAVVPPSIIRPRQGLAFGSAIQRF